jgi:hypothetical protein
MYKELNSNAGVGKLYDEKYKNTSGNRFKYL